MKPGKTMCFFPSPVSLFSLGKCCPIPQRFILIRGNNRWLVSSYLDSNFKLTENRLPLLYQGLPHKVHVHQSYYNLLLQFRPDHHACA